MKMRLKCKCGKLFDKDSGHDVWSCFECHRKAILEKERLKPVVYDHWLS